MNDITLTFTILGAVVVLMVWNRIPVMLMGLGTPLALYYTGILDMNAALGGLGDPVVIFVASLLVWSAALEAAGVTTWAGQLLVRKAGASGTRLLFLIMLVAALFTAVVSFVGAVAALLPVVVVARGSASAPRPRSP